MRSHGPFVPTDLEICIQGQVIVVINCVIFKKNALRVLELQDTEKMAFPAENAHRPYNNVVTH